MTLGRTVAVVAVLLAMTVPAALAGGVGAAPETLEFTVTRGGTSTSTLMLFADPRTDRELSLRIGGDAAEWITVAATGTTTYGSTFEVAEDGRTLVDVSVTMPDDVANGIYRAEIEVYVEDATATVRTAVVVPVTVEVIGDAIVDGVLEKISAPTTAVRSDEMVVTATVRNTGTVRARPTLTLVLTDGGRVLATGTTEYPELAPGASTDLIATLRPGSESTGGLSLEVVAALNGIEIGRESKVVEIVDAATGPPITPLGISATGPIETGGVLRLVASFRNDGVEPLEATFVGTVSRDGAVVTSVESIPVAAAPGATGTAELFVPTENAGVYTLAGRWVAGETSSALVEYRWELESPSSGIRLETIVAVVFGLAALLLVGVGVRYWRSSTTDDEPVARVEVGSRS